MSLKAQSVLPFISIIYKTVTHMTQTRMVIATYNNPPEEYEEYLEKWSKIPGVVYVTGQLEKGANGTPHLQYFV